jgi:hypothetical protein
MSPALISLSGFHGQVSRLTFTYEGDQIRLLSEQVIEMTIATSDSAGGDTGPGARIELRDSDGKVAHRQTIPNPVQTSSEVFSPDGSITRVDVARPSGVFTVLVPYIPAARTVILAAAGATPRDARELARFNLAAQDGQEERP